MMLMREGEYKVIRQVISAVRAASAGGKIFPAELPVRRTSNGEFALTLVVTPEKGQPGACNEE